MRSANALPAFNRRTTVRTCCRRSVEGSKVRRARSGDARGGMQCATGVGGEGLLEKTARRTALDCGLVSAPSNELRGGSREPPDLEPHRANACERRDTREGRNTRLDDHHPECVPHHQLRLTTEVSKLHKQRRARGSEVAPGRSPQSGCLCLEGGLPSPFHNLFR
jgi:hypothetical protein